MTLTKSASTRELHFLVLDHKNISGGRLWSTDGACTSGVIKSIWKVPKSYGGRSPMVGSETECECGPSSALQQLPHVASAASTRLSEYGTPSSYVKLGMCHRSPHPSTRKKNSWNIIWWGLFSGILYICHVLTSWRFSSDLSHHWPGRFPWFLLQSVRTCVGERTGQKIWFLYWSMFR